MSTKSRISFYTFILKEWFFLLILMIFFSNLLGTLGLYLGLLLVPLTMNRAKLPFYIDTSFIYLFLFSITYVISLYANDLFGDAKGYIIFYLIYPCVFYVIGRNLITKWYDQKFLILLLVIFSFAIPSIVIILEDIIENGYINSSRLIETKDGEFLAATLHGVNLSLGISCIGLLFAPTKNIIEKKYSFIFILFGFICLICNIHFINRTGVVIMGLSVFIVYIFKTVYFGFKKNLIVLFLMSIVLIGSYTSLSNSEILIGFNDRQEEQKYESIGGGRGSRWSQGVDVIFKNPFGGGDFIYGERYYAHNFWLDVGEMGGVIPLIPLILFTVLNLRKFITVVKQTFSQSFFFGSLLFLINLGFMLTFFVEPILEGNLQYVFAYFMFVGMTSMFNKKTSY
jgi:hypothetical protein